RGSTPRSPAHLAATYELTIGRRAALARGFRVWAGIEGRLATGRIVIWPAHGQEIVVDRDLVASAAQGPGEGDVRTSPLHGCSRYLWVRGSRRLVPDALRPPVGRFLTLGSQSRR